MLPMLLTFHLSRAQGWRRFLILFLTQSLILFLSACRLNLSDTKINADNSVSEDSACANASRPQSPDPAGSALPGFVPPNGVVVFSYDSDANALSALVCDGFLEMLFKKANPLAAVKKYLYSRNPESPARNSPAGPETRCRVVWGPSFHDVHSPRDQVSSGQDYNEVIWQAALKFGLAQLPTTGLMVAASVLASVTVGSSFHDIVATLEAGRVGEAIQVFQALEPNQVGWTATSLMLFGFSRAASALTMTNRAKVILEAREALAVSKFSEAYSTAFDEVVAEMQLQDLEYLRNNDGKVDKFMGQFAQALNVKVKQFGLSPGTVHLALQALTRSTIPPDKRAALLPSSSQSK